LDKDREWPRISIVTPSFNQGQFLEQTIRSVLLQGYPNLEYIVIDGGSSDESVDVIRKYEPWLKTWLSERDSGQADAINKGLKYCTGEIFQFLNSDDYLAPNALRRVARAFTDCDCVAGCVVDFSETGDLHKLVNSGLRPRSFVVRPPGFLYHQPGVWMSRAKVARLGGFDVSLRYKFDWELTIRYLERWPRVRYIPDELVFFRLHSNSKTVSEGAGFWDEELVAREILVHRLISRAAKRPLEKLIRKNHWRLRLDEIRTSGSNSATALREVLSEVLQHPLERIDRYTLGTLKSLLFKNG
jgi:glycosyltransferase involved in cell wall biosynthesis